LQASAVERAEPTARAAAEAIAEKNRAHGRAAWPNPPVQTLPGALRWPVMPNMTTAPVTGSVAMVLAAPDFVGERGLRDVAWLQGMGWATEPSFLGDRDLTSAPALAAAAQQAYARAGITDPTTSFDLAEVTDATPHAELLAYEALSLCPRDAWRARATDGSFARGGQLPVNLSGGVLTWNPVFCTGLIRIAEVANQIRGRAGRHQLPNVRCGLAHAGSGFAMQYQAAVVLGREARA
jgi:acetyl-CoA C-acetyltransferase